MEPNLQVKIDAVIEAEGGDKFTNDSADKGGPTKFGITERTARAFGYKGPMQQLDRTTAERIYESRYWLNPKFDKVNAISVGLAFLMFDWGVTSGPARPIKAMQRALNVLNQQGNDYPDIEADGQIGPITLHCLDYFVGRRGANGLKYLIGMVKAQRAVFYMEIAENDPTQERFMNGWELRVFNSEF